MATSLTLIAVCCSLFVQEPAQERAAVHPPAAPQEQLEKDLTEVRTLLSSGKATVEQIMSSTEWSHLREKPRFRRAIREAANSAKTIIVPSDEPGTPLIVSGVVRDSGGAPIAGAQVYVFQTSDNGSYSSRGGNAADMGDSLNPRLFGYMKTAPDGKYELRTIRPGQYPNDGPPAHIHYEITADGLEKKLTELMFEDDSRMTPGTKKWAVEAGFVVATPSQGADGVLRVTADWTLER